MSEQTVIDSLEFARAGQESQGSLPVRRLTRLHDYLFDEEGSVNFAVKGGRDEERRPTLLLEINGTLHLQCQRCLRLLEYRLNLANMLLLVRPGDDLSVNAEDPETPDCIEASEELDVAALIEDEILLSLPFAPRHAEDWCRSAVGGRNEEGEKASPFAKLAELKNLRQRQ